MGRLFLVTCLVLSVAACGSPASRSESDAPGSPSPVSTSPSNLDATGILLVGAGEQVESAPSTDALSTVFGQAIALVEGNPDDLGYPWIEPSTGEIVVSAATARGRALLEDTDIPVPHRGRDVAHSAAELQLI